ncbi:ribonuclease Z [Nitrogeniibacter mangrovi]|uniref:Ribonuclease Z n=1 Tax=Nitrogeniibacter mangrovi TaxID=2016596 RepID=A0A6C1B021_9RHOO|nr:ribonuclease Z [Nitrogeniibacter mangrovi]QID16158.1 ribonuclease Z [Nitrogeniibacter mangrovi]
MDTLLAPRLVNDVFGDPGLYVDVREARRALLFDLGELRPLWPRHLMRLSHVFVTHTHMDHFAGFDHLLRVILGRKPALVLTGGPGFIDAVAHKLAAYCWNVAHRYPVELRLEAREYDGADTLRRARFSSRHRFAREDDTPLPVTGGLLLDEPALRVRATVVDHGTPCLAYLIEEAARPRVDPARLAAAGYTRGAWLTELKQAVLRGMPDDTPIEMRWRDRDGDHSARQTVGLLRAQVLDLVPARRIGYVTDLCFTAANVAALEHLMPAPDQLYIEAVFRQRDADHAERKHHLTAHQAGTIARRLQAREVIPFHFSPRYADAPDALREEVRAAHTGQAP